MSRDELMERVKLCCYFLEHFHQHHTQHAITRISLGPSEAEPETDIYIVSKPASRKRLREAMKHEDYTEVEGKIHGETV